MTKRGNIESRIEQRDQTIRVLRSQLMEMHGALQATAELCAQTEMMRNVYSTMLAQLAYHLGEHDDDGGAVLEIPKPTVDLRGGKHHVEVHTEKTSKRKRVVVKVDTEEADVPGNGTSQKPKLVVAPANTRLPPMPG